MRTTKTRTVVALAAAMGIVLRPIGAHAIEPAGSVTTLATTGSAVASPAAQGVVAGPVMAGRLARLLWAGAQRALEILFKMPALLDGQEARRERRSIAGHCCRSKARDRRAKAN